MARLFPALTPDEIENPGERAVARALIEQLPNRFEIFHMPLLGYSGYLPFGLECLAVASLIDSRIGAA